MFSGVLTSVKVHTLHYAIHKPFLKYKKYIIKEYQYSTPYNTKTDSTKTPAIKTKPGYHIYIEIKIIRNQKMSSSSTASNASTSPILWTAITRNEIILAEAGADPYGGVVAQTARELLCRAPTPGYEFHSIRQQFQIPKFSLPGGKKDNEQQTPPPPPPVKGVKFHVFDRITEDEPEYNHMTADDPKSLDNFRIWSFAAVYDPVKITIKEVQAFLDKMIELTIVLRESYEWRTCGVLGVHNDFAPILQQRMIETVAQDPKVAAIQNQVELSKEIMHKNIEMILKNGRKIEELADDATRLQEMAAVFQKRADDVKRYQLYQNAKHGVLLGTAVAVGVGVVVTPLVAML
jgi:Synaptobrevin